MIIEIKIPGVGESITEALLSEWFKKDGDAVRKDEPLFVIETDKVTLEVTAEADGVLKIRVAAGETVAIGAVVGSIDTEALAARPEAGKEKPQAAADKPAPPQVAAPQAKAEEKPAISKPPAPTPAILPPSVRRLAAERNIDVSRLAGTGPGGRLTKGDVLLYLEQAAIGPPQAPAAPRAAEKASEIPAAVERKERKPMTPIRKRIAARLLAAKQNTAMLTTFNEIDMENCMALRARYKDAFQKKHGISLGFMSFFIRACVEALKEFPEVNAFIEGDDIIYHHYQHIGVAVGSERGLVVPVIRHAGQMTFAQIEQAILDFVAKIKDNRLELADLEGGTFTVSNGGVYGSLLSTPILNMPQSGILGMHKIEKRPVAIDDQVVIRPMMYVALSYDHRIVDGAGAVTCLKRIKELVENPERLLLEV
jgi:2-oxoglutarate dehydrogenase E2 component (dihydrolipoamide succinyltransferase)